MAALVLLFVCVSGLYAQTYTVVDYKYTINGSTAAFAIENLIRPADEEVFENEADLNKALERKKQTLWNTALFDRVNVTYSVSSTVDTKSSVIVEVEVTDADSSIIFPYPKYDSNYGFVFGIRYKEKNLFGLMASMDLSLDVTQQERSFRYGDYVFDIPLTGLKFRNADISAELLGDIDLLNKQNSYIRFLLKESGWKIGTAKLDTSFDLKYQYGDNTKSEYIFSLSETGWQLGPGKADLGFSVDFKPMSKPQINRYSLNAGYTDIQIGDAKLSLSFSGLYYPEEDILYMKKDSYHKITLGVSDINVKDFEFADTSVFTLQPAQDAEKGLRLYAVDNTFTVKMPDGTIKNKKLSNVVNWTIYSAKDSALESNNLKTNTGFSFETADSYTPSVLFKTWSDNSRELYRFDLDFRLEKTFKLLYNKLSISPIATLYNSFSRADASAQFRYSPFFEIAFSAGASGGEINRINSGESFYAFRDNFRHGVTYSLQAAGRYIPFHSAPEFFLRGEVTAFPLENAFFNPSFRLLGMTVSGAPRMWFNKGTEDRWRLVSEADSDYTYSYNAYTFEDYAFNTEGLGTILRGILNSNETVRGGGYSAKAVLAGNINLTAALFNFEDMGHTYISPFYDFVLFFADGKVKYLHSLGIEGIAIMDSHAAYPIRASLGFNADTLFDKLKGKDVDLEYELFIGMGWLF